MSQQEQDNKITRKVDEIANILEEYIKKDEEWKKRAEPVITFYENITFTNRAFIYVLKIVGLVGGAVAVLYAAIKYLR